MARSVSMPTTSGLVMEARSYRVCSLVSGASSSMDSLPYARRCSTRSPLPTSRQAEVKAPASSARTIT